jgi:hypothetical protein
MQTINNKLNIFIHPKIINVNHLEEIIKLFHNDLNFYVIVFL